MRSVQDVVALSLGQPTVCIIINAAPPLIAHLNDIFEAGLNIKIRITNVELTGMERQ